MHVDILSSITFLTYVALLLHLTRTLPKETVYLLRPRFSRPEYLKSCEISGPHRISSQHSSFQFVLGFAFGPLLLAPLSEMYGCIPVYNTCNVAFLIFTTLSAEAKSMGMLVAVRFLAGAFGVAVITCGSGSIADMMPPWQRGGAMAVWAVGPILGPVIGPVVGGFLVTAKGWRWVFWVISILVSPSLLNATLYTLHYLITNPLIGRCHYIAILFSEGNVCPSITGAECKAIDEGDQ